MTAHEAALKRLGEYVERRIAELGLEYAAVCRAGGFSDETLSKIRKGSIKARRTTYRKLERALMWAPGSVEAILAEGEPTSLPGDQAGEQSAERQDEHSAAAHAPEEAPRVQTLSPGEALRRVVRSSAREFGVTVDGLDEVFRAVRKDLGEIAPMRTDLSDLVRLGRAETGLSLEAVAAATVDAGTGERLVEADWLDRLERAALGPGEYPEYPQLDALVDVLNLDPALVQEAAGLQFMNVHTVWSDDGQVRGLVAGELDAEGVAKMQELMRLYRKSPQRRDGRDG